MCDRAPLTVASAVPASVSIALNPTVSFAGLDNDSATPSFQVPVDIVVNWQSSATALTSCAGEGLGICASATAGVAIANASTSTRVIDIDLLRSDTLL